jgi:phage tail tape-measure protein
MVTRKKNKRAATKPAKAKSPSRKNELEREAAGAIGGAAAGAAVGAIAGPPGAAVGAVLGATVGALAERTVRREAGLYALHDARLDAEIGVRDGDIGANNLKHPPARVGAFSAASSGAVSHDRVPAEGPIPEPDED